MDFNKLTIKSQEAVAAAQELARRNGNPELYPEHLLLALLDQDLPRELVPDADALRAQAEATLAQKPRSRARSSSRASRRRSRTCSTAPWTRRSGMEDDYVSTEHLLLALDVVPRDTAPREDQRGARRAAASRRRIPRTPTRRSRSSAATSPRPPRRASSTRSSAATRRSAA